MRLGLPLDQKTQSFRKLRAMMRLDTSNRRQNLEEDASIGALLTGSAVPCWLRSAAYPPPAPPPLPRRITAKVSPARGMDHRTLDGQKGRKKGIPWAKTLAIISY